MALPLPVGPVASGPDASLPACLCGGSSYRRVRGPWQSLATGIHFEIVACRICGLARTAPPPYEDELEAEIYQTELPYEAVTDREEQWRDFFAPLLAAAKRHRPTGRFLDLGCGVGLLVEMAREVGYDAWGVEISKRTALHARDVLGRNVVHSDLVGANFPDGHFEVVVLSHVLEHLSNPKHVFAEIQRVLSPGGVVVIEVPNMDGLQVSLLRQRWTGWAPSLHVWQFTPRTLASSLLRLRLETIELACRHNTYFGEPLHPIKRLLRHTLFRGVELMGSALNRSDKILCVARSTAA
jgi:SAM-dependent methyltransferase